MDSSPIKPSPKKRKTSTRAISVDKFEKAMTEAGFQSRQQLYDKIAEIFGSASEDSVAKMARGGKVGHQIIRKVTTALGIEHDALFEDSGIEQSAFNDGQHQSRSNTKLAIVLFFSILFILVFVLVWIATKQTKEEMLVNAVKFGVDKDALSLTILNNNTAHEFKELRRQMRQQTLNYLDKYRSQSSFDKALKLTSSDAAIIDGQSPESYVEALNADLIISIETITKGRYLAIFIYALDGATKELLFADVFARDSLQDYYEKIALAFAKILINRLDNEVLNKPLATNKEAVEALLTGLYALDGNTTVNSISMALTHFYRAEDLAPDYAKSTIAVCKGLLRMRIATADSNYIKEADNKCAQVDDSTLSEVWLLTTEGEILKAQGHFEDAITLFDKALERSPNSVLTHLSKAEAFISKATSTGDVDYFKKALMQTTNAQNINPAYWRGSLVEGRVHFFSGNVQKAMQKFQESVVQSPNITNLTNLGTAHFCYGNLDITRKSYERAAKLRDTGAQSYYNLGSILSFYEENEAASIQFDYFFERAELENMQPTLEIIIGIADVYIKSGRKRQAEELYKRFYVDVEKKRLTSGLSNADKLLQLKAKVALDLLHDNAINAAKLAEYKSELATLKPVLSDPNSSANVMYLHIKFEQWEEAREIHSSLKSSCKGYARAPGTEVFAD